jgi:hypothetical protein
MNNMDEEYIDDAFDNEEISSEEEKEDIANALVAERHIQNDLVDKEVEQVTRKNDDHKGYALPMDGDEDEDEDDEDMDSEDEEEDEEPVESGDEEVQEDEDDDDIEQQIVNI